MRAYPGVCLGSPCAAELGFDRAGMASGSLNLSPSPVFLVWSCGGRKNVSLLIVTAQAFSSSSLKNHWNALNNK